MENEFDFDPIEFLEAMQSKAVEPNRVTFLLMIDRFCQTYDISEAIKMLELMKSKDMAISEPVFNSLIRGYGKTGDLQMSVQTFDMLTSAGVEPSADAFTALLCAYVYNIAKPESELKINSIFEELKRNEIELNANNIFKIIKALVITDPNSKLLDQLLDKANKSVDYKKECMNAVNALLFANRFDSALKLYQTMEPMDNQIESKSMGNAFIKSMVNANIDSKIVIEFCEKLESEGKNEFAIRNATEFALLSASIPICRTYLDRFTRNNPFRVHYIYPLITKCKNEIEILEVLSEGMTSFTGASFTQLTELFIDYIWPKNILDIKFFIEKCKSLGFSYEITYSSLFQYLMQNNRTKEAIELITSPQYSSIKFVESYIIDALVNSIESISTRI